MWRVIEQCSGGVSCFRDMRKPKYETLPHLGPDTGLNYKPNKPSTEPEAFVSGLTCYNGCNYLLQCTLYQPDRKVHLFSKPLSDGNHQKHWQYITACKGPERFRGHLYITFYITSFNCLCWRTSSRLQRRVLSIFSRTTWTHLNPPQNNPTTQPPVLH